VALRQYERSPAGGFCIAVGILALLGGIIAFVSAQEPSFGRETAAEVSRRLTLTFYGNIGMGAGVSLIVLGLILSAIHKVADQVRDLHETVHGVVEKAKQQSAKDEASSNTN